MPFMFSRLGGLISKSSFKSSLASQSITTAGLVGSVVGGHYLASHQLAPLSSISCNEPDPPGLSPQEFRSFPVHTVETINHNTKLLRFNLQTPQTRTGLNVASCLVTKATINSEDVIRPYTPVTLNDTRGHFDLIVKEYPQGLMSKHICNLRPGDELLVKGPFPKLQIKPGQFREIGMVAGGSGITPMYQVIQELLSSNSSSSQTKMTLVYCNVTEADILLRAELDALVAAHPSLLTVCYCLDKPPTDGSWKGFTGFFSEDMARKCFPPPSSDEDPKDMVLVCGPPPMMKAISGDKMPDKSQGPLEGLLKKMGYSEKMVYKF
eukprot:Nk52_evm4s327 gene=Nk52_evmTU4s327